MSEIKKFRFSDPTTCSVIGPTYSGKTLAVLEIIKYKKELFNNEPKRVIWFYGAYNSIFDRFKGSIEFIEGLDTLPDLETNGEHALVVVDDLMGEINKELSLAFTQKAHHENFSIFYLTQVLYQKNPIARVISLNSHYLLVFKSFRDQSSLSRLGSQLFPGTKNIFFDLYKMLTHQPYSYCVINLHPSQSGTSAGVHRGILPYEIENVFSF
jgi:hypothetical protein